MATRRTSSPALPLAPLSQVRPQESAPGNGSTPAPLPAPAYPPPFRPDDGASPLPWLPPVALRTPLGSYARVHSEQPVHGKQPAATGDGFFGPGIALPLLIALGMVYRSFQRKMTARRVWQVDPFNADGADMTDHRNPFPLSVVLSPAEPVHVELLHSMWSLWGHASATQYGPAGARYTRAPVPPFDGGP